MDTWNNGYNLGINNPIGVANPTYRMPNNAYNVGYMPPAPRYELIKVRGEAGANNFRMAPNSQALLLDETAPIVWHAQTDGTGYLSLTPYDIMPHQQVPPVDINNLAQRVSQLEELINARQSNTKQPKKQRQQQQSDSAAMESASIPTT